MSRFIEDVLKGYKYYQCVGCNHIYPISEHTVGYWLASSFRPVKEEYKTISYSKILEETNHLACAN